jgi:hypothetical protein
MVRKPASVVMAALPLGGCSDGAPTIFLAGAYIPAWLVCAVAGVLGAVVVRVVLVALSIDDALPFRLGIYVCIAAAIGFLVSLVAFGR